MNTEAIVCIILCLALAGSARAQSPNVCVANGVENNLILVTADTMPYECQTDARLCPRAQNEFWNYYGGKSSDCWAALVEDGWSCMVAAATYAGATGCRACGDDDLGVFQCPGVCSDVVSKCKKTVKVGNCFFNQAEPQCFGPSDSCTKWKIDKDVLEEQSGLTNPDGGSNSAGELIGSFFSVACAVVFALLLAGNA